MEKQGNAAVAVVLLAMAAVGYLVVVVSKPAVVKRPPVVPSPIPTVSLTPTLSPSPIPPSSPSPTPTKKPAPTIATPKPVTGPPGTGYSRITVATERGNFTASVLSLDLAGVKIITDTANDSECGSGCAVMALGDFVSRNGGFAGVNGTYFCPSTYGECSSKSNSFDFPVYNSRLGRWINGGNLFWDSRSMIYFDGSGVYYKQNAKDFGGGLSAGIVNHPGLLDGGNVQIDDSQSGLSEKQKAKGTKVGIGIRGDKSLMVVIAQNVTMQELAYVFKALGANGALNLDSGGSVALYYDGKYLTGPGRNIPNAIVFAR